MNTEPSQRPWRAEQPGDECRFWTIRNPDGVSVCTAWREADASLIVDAVNERAKFEAAHMEFPDLRPVIIAAGQRDAAIAERDRLRDIVRNMLRAIDALYTVAAPCSIVKELTPDRTCLGVPIGKIIADARAAIGEGQP